jgi:hypothetical protein
MTEHNETIPTFEVDAIKKTEPSGTIAFNDDAGSGLVLAKFQDAMTPGYQAEFDPAEAEVAGAFREDALSEADAIASTHDTLHFQAPVAPAQEK